MLNQKGLTLTEILVSSVVVIVLLLGGYYFLVQNSDEEPESSNIDTDNTGETPTMQVPAPGHEDVDEMIVNGEMMDDEEMMMDDEEMMMDDDKMIIHDEADNSVKEFNMTAKQWEFSPEIIEVNKGDNVILNIESVDVNHGLSLPDFNVSEFLSPGKTTTIEFIADKSGTFTFSCNVQCGRGHGNMRGTLIVN